MTQHNSPFTIQICVDLDRIRHTRNGAFIDLSVFRARNGPKLVPDHHGRYNVMLSASTFTDRNRNGPGPHPHLHVNDQGDYNGAIIRLHTANQN